jgi:hypothetical protein
VEVLRRDAVRELVQVRLPDIDPARRLEPLDRLGARLRDMRVEDRRAVRRPDPGRIEEILDGEPPTGRRGTVELRDPDRV